MDERRRYPRFHLKINAKYRVLDPEEVFKLGITRNISAEGICFESEEELRRGTHVSLEVDLRDKMPAVTLVGEIRWFRESKAPGSKKKKYVNGVKLLDIQESDEGRFLKYYCDRMVEKLAGYLKL